MKKLLLSALMAGAGVAMASAQSFEFYVSNSLEKGINDYNMEVLNPVNYNKVSEGDVIDIKINPCELYTDGEYFQVAECMAYTRIVNTSGEDINMTIAYEQVGDLETNVEELGKNIDIENFITCVGGRCVSANPFSFEIPANGETDSSRGEHMGFGISSEEEGLLDKLTLEATYNFTVTAGDDTLHFTLKYTSGSAAVDTIGSDDIPAVYYNMQGIKVATPEAGQIYIVRKGNKVSKMIF